MKDKDRFIRIIFGFYFGYFIFKFLIKLIINSLIIESVLPAQELFLISEVVQFAYLLILIALVDRQYKWSKPITGVFLIVISFFEFFQTCLRLIDLQNYNIENGQEALPGLIMKIEFFHYLLFPYQFVIFGLGIFIFFVQTNKARKD